MDKNYHSRITHRRATIDANPTITLGINNDSSRIRPAVSELYTFLTGTYLPSRYPDMFRIHHTQFESGNESVLQNLVTEEMIPTRPTNASTTSSTRSLLKTLGRHLDEDFLLLLPERGVDEKKKDDGDGKYVLEAYVSCTPAGFNPAAKLGKKLAEIHGPVPGYAQKLEGSMDRFFAKVEVGQYVKRANWSVSMSEDLFQPGLGTHHALVGGDEVVEEFQGRLDPDKVSPQILLLCSGGRRLCFCADFFHSEHLWLTCSCSYSFRRLCDVNGRHYTAYRGRRRWFLRSRRTCIPFGRSRTKGWVRSWQPQLMV